MVGNRLPLYDAARVGAWVCGRAAEIAVFEKAESEESLLPRHVLEKHEPADEYDDERHVQKLQGLIALCPACSDVKHYARACAQGREEDAKAHFLKVNGWSAGQMQGYVAEAKALWEKRSACEWTQDITWLRNNKPAK